MKLGALIEACRVRKGYSQEKLAELMHRSRSCISKYENDQKVPDVPTFMKLMQLTNANEVAVAYLCGFDGISIMTNILHMVGA